MDVENERGVRVRKTLRASTGVSSKGRATARKAVSRTRAGSVSRAAAAPEERHRIIAEAAYYRAERRGFSGGEQEQQQDWLEAEAEIDALLSTP